MWVLAGKKPDHAAVYLSSSMLSGVAVTSCCNLDNNYSTSEFKEGRELLPSAGDKVGEFVMGYGFPVHHSTKSHRR